MSLPHPTDPSTAPIDAAYEQFRALASDLAQFEGMDLSESDTRSKVIDPVIDLLGWKESAITREEHEKTNGRYLDYKLSTTQPVFVIEAKKNFIRFKLPAGAAKHFRVGGAISNDPELVAAIEQARSYANNKGIPFCCVTNGFQFAFFRPSNQIGVSWGQYLVVVFRDHAEIARRFSDFYNILSYEAVIAGRFTEHIPLNHHQENIPTRFHGFCSELKLEFGTRDRNALFAYTKELIQAVFQSLDNDDASPELLEFCYVESARDSSYERGIGELLKEHKTKISEPTIRLQPGKKDAGAFQDRFRAVSARKKASVTLLLGTVGAGKTTFLNRFRKVFAKEIIDRDFIWIHISFNNFVEAQDVLSDWIYEKLEEAIKLEAAALKPFTWEALQEIYKSEINELRDGLLSPYYRNDTIEYEKRLADELRILTGKREPHLLRTLEHTAKKSGRRIILVFDNADHHSARLQNDVFLMAQKYSGALASMVFLSLREESYWRNKEHGGLSAFHSTAFQLSAPRIEQVLAKRFKYALLLIEGNSEIAAEEYVTADLDLDSGKILTVFKVLQASLLGEDKRFVRFLEYIAPGEIRQSLDLVARFLTSGHTNVNRIMDRAGRGGISPVGFHEFLQAVMLGDRVYYKEEFSDVVNVYAVDGRGDQSHFNRLAVIARLMSAVGESSDRGKGFVAVEQVIRDCESLGILAETCMVILSSLVQKRVLATDTFVRESINKGAYVRATAAAYYYVSELAGEFEYIDCIVMDTEIGDGNVRNQMADMTRSILAENDRYKRLKIRIERARVFLKYLNTEYEASSLNRSSANFDVTTKMLVSRSHDSFEQQAARILENARKAFGRNML